MTDNTAPKDKVTANVVQFDDDTNLYHISNGVEEGDTVILTSNNCYDRRYSDEFVTEGTVQMVYHNPDHGGIIVLRVKGEGRTVDLKANGDVSIEKTPTRSKTIGRVKCE